MKPKINLCTFNVTRVGIFDQIWFAKELFFQNGYEFLCTNALRPDCLNLLIENFVDEDIETLSSFARRFKKKIGVIMTEHIELEAEGFTFGGAQLTDMEYIRNKKERLFGLLSITDYAFGYFTFGDLPKLHTWNRILPGHRPYHLPYPSIHKTTAQPTRPDYDIVFTGVLTPHRKSVLRELAKKYRVRQSELTKTEEERAAHYAKAKIAVTVPQTKDWRWISPMRVLFGLRAGLATIDLGQDHTTTFARSVLSELEIERAVTHPGAAFEQQLQSYARFVQSPENGPFPSGIFDLWAELEFSR